MERGWGEVKAAVKCKYAERPNLHLISNRKLEEETGKQIMLQRGDKLRKWEIPGWQKTHNFTNYIYPINTVYNTIPPFSTQLINILLIIMDIDNFAQ